jgi:PDZ domain-containing secreted protein
MKKSTLLIASILVSSVLVSGYSIAGPSKKKEIEPVVEVSIQTTHSSTNWFFDLFDF